MRNAPPLAGRVIVSAFTKPAFTAPVIAVTGYDEQHRAFHVVLSLPYDVAPYEPLAFAKPHHHPFMEAGTVKADAMVRQLFDGEWHVIDPREPIAAPDRIGGG